MNKQQQMQDILKETVEYYREDPAGRRCVTDDGECMYTWGNNHCAIGRYLREEYKTETWDCNNESVNELCEHNPDAFSVDWVLRDGVHGIDPDFWASLQDIHDTTSYWEEWNRNVDGVRKYGFTDRGKEAYVELQDKIAEGRYDD